MGYVQGPGAYDDTGVLHNLSTTGDGVRADAALFLTQTIAPFLIVAERNVFFSFAWFYDMASGYIPCPDGVECGIPGPGWFPEFSRPIGEPKGQAVRNGNVYTRSFAHLDVYVDLDDRSKCKLTWHTPSPG